MKIYRTITLTCILFVVCNVLYAQDFFECIMNGDYNKVEQFIQDEPKLVDSIVKWECTPLIFAAYWGKDSIVELLLNKGADVYKVGSDNGMVPLHFAAMNNSIGVVELLVKHGVDLNVKDASGVTALSIAIENNSKEIIDLLLKAKATLPTNIEVMNTCLHAAIRYNLQVIADKLLENGASLMGTDPYGRNVLHNALIGNNTKWFDVLIEKDSLIDAVDHYNRTPLHYAVDLNQLEHVKALVKNNANINAIDNSNRTPLSIALDYDFAELTAFLVSKGGRASEPVEINIGESTQVNSKIEVTSIANMGVMLSSKTQRVLIDAVFNESYYNYATTPENVVNKLKTMEAPYDAIDLILVTHSDGDHFSAPMIAEYMAVNPTVKVVCNYNTASAIKDTMDSTIDSTRIIGILPELFSSSDTVVNNIAIKVMRLRHSDRGDDNDNIGFILEMDGMKIFHQGDAGGNVQHGTKVGRIQEYDSIGIAQMNIDLAILGRGSVSYDQAPGLQIIKKLMKPKYIVLGHMSYYDRQGEWQGVEHTLSAHKTELPDITVFRWPMQKVIVYKGE